MKKRSHSILISILISILLFSCNAAMPQKDVFEAPVIFYDKATGTVSIGLTQNDPNPIQYTINNGNALNYNSSFSCTSFSELTAFTEMSKKGSISYPYNPREIASPEISISYNSDDTKNITITAGNGYRIFYSLDDAEPYANRYIKEYRGPIRSELEKTVKAIAYNPEDGTYSKTAVSAFELAKPQVELKNAPEGGKIVSVDVEHGAVAYYTTDGSDPFTSSTRTRYDGEFKVVKSGLYRFACQKDEIKSEILDLEISIIPAPGIEFTEGLSSSRTITITAPEGLEIRYTLDGKNPETDGIVYNGPFEITDNHVIKAVTFQNGFYSSIIESTAIIRIDKPLCWFEETYDYAFNVTAKTDTLDGEVWYTLDSTDPRSSATAMKVDGQIRTEPGIIKLAVCSHGYWSEVLEMPIKSTRTYVIGESGPKGGIIVYDCDADNDRGNADGLVSSACGWRYIEAQKSPLSISKESVNTSDAYTIKTPLKFGYHVDENGNDVYVNGSSTYDGSCTSDRIGSGKANTIKLIDSMRHEYAKAEILNQEYAALYANLYGYDSTSHYAVSLDWFLPSIEELKLIKEVTGQDLSAWSSTEDPENPGKALVYDSKSGQAVSCDRGELHDIYVTRTFIPSAVDAPSVYIEKQTDGSSTVKFNCHADAEITYTIDGTDPYTSETAVKCANADSLTLRDEVLLRAYTSLNGFTDSSETSILVNGEKKIPAPVLQDNGNRTITARSEGFEGDIFYATTDPAGTPNRYMSSDTLWNRDATLRVMATFVGFLPSEISEITVTGYAIGDVGPAGGKIIYDCDADNDLEDNDGLVSSECGWRFMEAATGYMKKSKGRLTIYNSYNPSKYSLPEYAGKEPTDPRAIGSGIENTRMLLDFAVADDRFYDDFNAARNIRLLNIEHDGKTFNDWFIPSIEELKLCEIEDNYPEIASSSVINTNGSYEYVQLNRNSEITIKEMNGKIIPVRVFAADQIAIPEMKISYDGDLTYAELSSPDANAIIYYTIDGTDPRTSTTRTPYTERLKLEKKTLIRAIASMDEEFSLENFNVAGAEEYSTDTEKLEVSRMEDGSLEVYNSEGRDYPIHYTLDGSIPTESSPVIEYDKTVIVDKDKVMKYAHIEQGFKYMTSVINASDYQIGETGPAGGVIIYDCDADNASGNKDGLKSDECGWRYLECATKPIISNHGRIGLGEINYIGHVSKNDYGFFLSDNNERAFLNGTTTYNAENCTRTEIGQGINNTRIWLDAFKMNNVWHKTYSGYLEKSHDYPARFCNLLRSEHAGKVYDDWFLPSKDELKLIPYSIRQKLYACSSSETNDPESIWAYNNQDQLVMQQRDAHFNIIPIRAFNVDAVETPSFTLRYEGDDTVVEISCNTGNAVIHYTTDGSTPTASSKEYSTELRLKEATMIRAIATNGTDKDSMENFLLAGGEPVLEQPKIDFKSTRNYNDPYESTLSIESRNIGDVYYTMNPDNGREYQITWIDPDYSSTLYDAPLTMTTNPKNKDKSNFFSAIRLADGYKPSKISRFRTGEYGIGAKGPEGGTIIYDILLDDHLGNKDGLSGDEGWRYIEAAYNDVHSLAYVEIGGCFDHKRYMPFGELKDSNGNIVYTNGTTTYDEKNCTSRKIGSGRANTDKLYYNKLTRDPDGMATIMKEKLLQNNVELDQGWAIPSIEELKLVHRFSASGELYGTPMVTGERSDYWSSTESEKTPGEAYSLNSFSGYTPRQNVTKEFLVRPVRYVYSYYRTWD